jgi:hypothetical protein
MISEEQINRWANPPSDTESEKCANAIKQITDALRDHFGDKVSFIRQGSHRNNTNIRHDSDVDIAVVYSGSYFPGTGTLTPSDKQLYESRRSSATYPYGKFKEDVNVVLQAKFGLVNTQRKNKCIRINGSTYRVNADVVPVFPYRRYSAFGVVGAEGIALVPDNSSDVIHSFPNQHYDNGVAKNNKTGKAFKSVVRILKNVRNDLSDNGLLRGGDMPSFFIESLVWNVPDSSFAGKTYRDDALAVSSKIWNDMKNPSIANEYAEVCDLRWLFKGSPHRTHAQAQDFALQVWNHIKTS